MGNWPREYPGPKGRSWNRDDEAPSPKSHVLGRLLEPCLRSARAAARSAIGLEGRSGRKPGAPPLLATRQGRLKSRDRPLFRPGALFRRDSCRAKREISRLQAARDSAPVAHLPATNCMIPARPFLVRRAAATLLHRTLAARLPAAAVTAFSRGTPIQSPVSRRTFLTSPSLLAKKDKKKMRE